MKSSTILLTFGLLALPMLALAQDTGAAVTTTVTTPGGTAVSGQASATFETKAKARGDQEIDRRTTNLNEVLGRIGEMKKVNDTDKANLQSTVSAEITTLTALKAKIDADSVLADLKSDVQSITKSYRVYALLLPQIHVIAAADRSVTTVQQMAVLEGKLAMRIASSTGDTTALIAADTDLKAKVTDANTQASAAVGVVAALQPDNGDAKIAASNRAALKDAQSKIKLAIKDLNAARQDIAAIISGLKGAAAGVRANQNASSSAQTQ
jgi:hypothetical protein